MFPVASAFETVYQFFVQGGFFMLLLLLLSVAAVTVMVLRGMALYSKRVVPPELAAEIDALKPGEDLDQLLRSLKENPSPLARVIRTLIGHLEWPREEVVEAVQLRARNEIVRLETGLVILEITTGVAPLLGLLGTLSGLVSIFANLGDAASGDPVAVARGISEALNTTIVGLAVAAPSLIAFNYFSRKVETLSVRMESIAADLIAKCFPHDDARPTFQ